MKLITVSWLLVGFIKLNAQQNSVDKTRVAEYLQNEEYKEAINYLLPSTESGDNIYILNALGYAHLMIEDISKAEFFYSKTYSLDSTNLTANKYLAQIEREKDNFIGALYYHERMILLQPGNASIYKSTAELLNILKRPDSALLYYSKAYSLQPYNLKYASPYITQLLYQKKYIVADSILNIFLAIDSTNVPTMMLAIRSDYEKGNYTSANSFSNRWLNIGRMIKIC